VRAVGAFQPSLEWHRPEIMENRGIFFAAADRAGERDWSVACINVLSPPSERRE
jgi:hypothetical protein